MIDRHSNLLKDIVSKHIRWHKQGKNVESDLELGSYNAHLFQFTNLNGVFLHKRYMLMQNSVSLKCQVQEIAKMLLMVCV